MDGASDDNAEWSLLVSKRERWEKDTDTFPYVKLGNEVSGIPVKNTLESKGERWEKDMKIFPHGKLGNELSVKNTFLHAELRSRTIRPRSKSLGDADVEVPGVCDPEDATDTDSTDL